MSGQREQRNSGRFSTTSLFVAALLLTALVGRVAAAIVWQDDLSTDRDGYLGIAEHIAAGSGFLHPVSDRPTAYRPPLYPLMLAPILYSGCGAYGIAALHVLLGTGTAYLAYLIGRRLGLNRGAVIACGLVAFDPMLLRYTANAMTETLFTFLVALLLVVGIGRRGSQTEFSGDSLSRRSRPLFVGILFGLCALCRPTIWAFGVLACLVTCWRQFRKHDQVPAGDFRWRGALTLLGVALTVSPWLMRNLLVLKRPIVTTTHGGYTLLLGNNPVFYDEVVRQPWGAVWTSASLDRWQKTLKRPADGAGQQPEDEVARDRRMYNQAITTIKAEPTSFLLACWLRLRRFWNVVPLSTEGESRSRIVNWSVGLYYTAVSIAFAVSLWRMWAYPCWDWIYPLLLIGAFTFVHLFYWSNARMRAPLIPAIALVAARCFDRKRADLTEQELPDNESDETKSS